MGKVQRKARKAAATSAKENADNKMTLRPRAAGKVTKQRDEAKQRNVKGKMAAAEGARIHFLIGRDADQLDVELPRLLIDGARAPTNPAVDVKKLNNRLKLLNKVAKQIRKVHLPAMSPRFLTPRRERSRQKAMLEAAANANNTSAQPPATSTPATPTVLFGDTQRSSLKWTAASSEPANTKSSHQPIVKNPRTANLPPLPSSSAQPQHSYSFSSNFNPHASTASKPLTDPSSAATPAPVLDPTPRPPSPEAAAHVPSAADYFGSEPAPATSMTNSPVAAPQPAEAVPTFAEPMKTPSKNTTKTPCKTTHLHDKTAPSINTDCPVTPGRRLEDIADERLQLTDDLEDAFIMFDRNGTGTVSVDEVATVLESFGLPYDEATLKEMMGLNLHGGDRRRSVSRDDFVALLSGTMLTQEDDETRLAFDLLDTDHDGRLGHAELKQGLCNLGMDVTDSEVWEMIQEADGDGDGFIDFKEFQTMQL